jgi:teichuronic acid biosynthesis glycosyltransferase TuaC
MPIKVLSLSTVYPNPNEPGLGLFIQRRLEHLAKLADVMVVAPVLALDYRTFKLNRSVPKVRRDGNVTVFHPRWLYVPGTGSLTPFALLLQLVRPVWRIHRSAGFDVIDAHFGYPEAIAGALLAMFFKAPFTVTLRGSELLHQRYALRRRLMRWALLRASCVFTVSAELSELAVWLGVAVERVKLIPNGVDGKLFQPLDGQAVREKLRVPKGRRVLLTAGHLIELKGHHHVIAALRRLVDEGADVELWIAGAGGNRGVQDYEPTLRRLVDELNLNERVRFLGRIEPADMPLYFAGADVFCVASSREGWPNVLNEALACGVPAIAARVGSVPVLIPSERYGLLLPSVSAAALTETIKRALSMEWDRNAISIWGRSRSWENVAHDVLQHLEEIALPADRVMASSLTD